MSRVRGRGCAACSAALPSSPEQCRPGAFHDLRWGQGRGLLSGAACGRRRSVSTFMVDRRMSSVPMMNLG
eukprot:4111426-Pyramimonas_sp.AAC.1